MHAGYNNFNKNKDIEHFFNRDVVSFTKKMVYLTS